MKHLNVEDFTFAPKQIDISRFLGYSRELIWKELIDYQKMTHWFPMIRNVEVVKNGKTHELGVGCERECQFGNVTLEETILFFDPQNNYAFKIKDNKMMKNHLAIFSIEAKKNGKQSFRFQSYFEPQGNLVKRFLFKNVLFPLIARKALKNFETKVINKLLK